MSDDLIRAAAEHDRVSNAREDAAWVAAFYLGLIEAGIEAEHAWGLTAHWIEAFASMAIAETGSEAAS